MLWLLYPPLLSSTFTNAVLILMSCVVLFSALGHLSRILQRIVDCNGIAARMVEELLKGR